MRALTPSFLSGVLLIGACTGTVGSPETSADSPGSGGGAGGGGAQGGSAGGVGPGGSQVTGATGGTDGTATPPPATASQAPAATPTLARLSVQQWANTVRDLLQLANPGDLDNSLTKDAVVRFDNEADSLFVGQALHDDLQSEAERLAGLVVADPKAVARLVPAGAPTDLAGKAKSFIQSFGRRAYRRPLSDSEVQDYVTLFNQGPTLTAGLAAFEAGMRVTLEAFLQSPAFLYRTSIGGPAVAGKARLTAFEIAANLSYAITNAPPDAMLADAADKGALATSKDVETQARRLLPSTLGKSAVNRFYFQYFGLGQYDTLQKDPAVAPQFTDATGPLLHAEAQQLLSYLFDQNLGLREIFTTPVGFVNAPVAKLYGLPGTFDATAWKQVSFDPKQRPGILSRLGFVSYYAHQALQDTIHRGANINSRILCTELSPPPNIQIPPLPPQDPSKTNRELVAGFTQVCGAACHVPFINPAGFAFENFDGLGNYRTMENGKPIDTSGTYSFEDGDKSFPDLAGFTQMLAESSQAHACYAKKWAASLYARIPRRDDENLVTTLAQRSVDQHLSSADLVISLVTSDPFVTRIEEGAP